MIKFDFQYVYLSYLICCFHIDATDMNRGTVSPSTPPGSPPSENVTSDLSAINPIDKMTKLMMSDLSEKGAGDYVTNKLHNLTLKVLRLHGLT